MNGGPEGAVRPADVASRRDFGVFIAGEWQAAASSIEVVDKYDGSVLGSVGVPSPAQVDAATTRAADVVRGGALPPERRVEVLSELARLIRRDADELVAMHTAETGFTLRESRTEIERTVRTLELCAEEVKRLCGDMVPIAWYPQSEGRTAYTEFHPVGPVVAITPFNSPLNTVAHKVGPALGAGNPVILKPAVQAPLSAALFTDLLVEAGLPAGFLSTVFGGADVGEQLTHDQRIGFYAFTGSSAVGLQIARSIGLRRSQLELGSLASTIVCADADVELVAAQVSYAGYRKAGQVCTSVQRLIVHERVLDEVVELVGKTVGGLVTGDPRLPETQVGPLIGEDAANRAQAWVSEAEEAGASVIVGGEARGAVMKPTLLTGVQPSMKVVSREVFAPVVSVVPFCDLDDAIDLVNSSPYGLAAGIFTENYKAVRSAAQRARVGTLQVNATSSNRYDSMPFGGVKDSGFGREGPRYAMRAMSDELLIVWN